MRILRRLAFAWLLVAAAVPVAASAASFPSRTIRMIVTFPPGGPADIFGRVLAQEMSTRIGQTIIVDNRGGANGLVGVTAIVKSAPDGYTIGVTNGQPLTISPSMMASMPFDLDKDLSYLTLIAKVPQVMATNGHHGIKSLAELVAFAKANPGKLNYSSGGVGALGQLSIEKLKADAGIEATVVPYAGGAPALQALLAGNVDFLALDIPLLLPSIKAGTIQAIAITDTKPSAVLSGVPTIVEAGYPNALASSFYGLIAPANLPRDVQATIAASAKAALESPELRQRFEQFATEPSPGTPEEFRAFVKSERDRWAPLIQALGLREGN